MSTTKRLLALLLSLMMVLSLLVSCGGEEADPKPDGDNPSQGGEQTPSGDTQNPDEGGEEEDAPRFTPLAVQNKLDILDATQRLFYPDTPALITGLETVKANLDGAFADPTALRSYLTGLYAEAQGLGIYADYAGHTSLTAGDVTYGAVPDDYAIGGGLGYPLAGKKYAYYVTNDDTLKTALQYAKKGDVIVITEDICIDMSDWLLGGEVDGFTIETGKIKYEMVIPEGVTLMGQRGTGVKGGAIIKVSSYTNVAMRLCKDARLSGLVIQGPDTPFNKDVPSTNHSIGIMIDGDGARIDNCEISGFSRQAIVVKDAKDVKIDHNYIHHLQGTSGIAVYANNAIVSLEYNLFSQVNTIASVFGPATELTVENNVCVSENDTPLFLLASSPTYDEVYKKARISCKSIVLKNNTFLCGGDLFSAAGIPTSVTIEQNLFAYPETLYLDRFDEMRSVDSSIYDLSRISIKSNVYNILAPKVMSKSSKGLLDDGVSLTAYTPVVKEAVKVNVTPVKMTVVSASYYPTETDAPYFTLKDMTAYSDNLLKNFAKESINTILKGIGGYTNYLTYLDQENIISQVVDGQTYGATADERGQVGGGVGYHQIFTEKDATVVVRTKGELVSAVKSAKDGDIIYVHEDARIDLSDAQENKMTVLLINKKIILCSNRGYVREDGSVSTGGVLMSTALTSAGMIALTAEGARLTGLTIYGPDPATHVSHHRHAFSQGNFPPCDHHAEGDLDHAYYYNLQPTYGVSVTADNVEIDNCEVSGFSGSAIGLNAHNGVESRGIQIHHNYIHHNQLNGLGYGVAHSMAYSVVSHNLFNYNRHSIAGTGAANSGYIAHNNIEMGDSLSTYFDMHGGKDRGDGTDTAGEYCYIFNNTYLGTHDPYNLRGRATKDRLFNYNVVYQSRASYGSRLTHNHYGADELLDNVKIGSNIWGIDNGKGKVEKG